MRNGTTLNTPICAYRSSRRRREREKRPEKISEEIIAENFPNVGKSHPSPGSRESHPV